MFSIKIYRKWLSIQSRIELIITETNELLSVIQNGSMITSEKHQSITHDIRLPNRFKNRFDNK